MHKLTLRVMLLLLIQGIAMGMLLGDKSGLSDENAVIVSDILGQEDALGTMDFKVAGNKDGITTFQLDIKCEGLTLQTMERALDQAKAGRLHILGEMAKVISSLLKLNPNERPNTIELLQNPSVHKYYKGEIDIAAEAEEDDFLLKTLKVNHANLRSIKQILPKANYEG